MTGNFSAKYLTDVSIHMLMHEAIDECQWMQYYIV